MASNHRDDFPEPVKRALGERVAWHCTICLRLTMGPHSDETKSLKTGHAAHIHAASPLGPRYNPNQTPEQRKAIANGIWACKDCGDQIDKDEDRYKAEDLRRRKLKVEDAIDFKRRSGFSDGYRALQELAPRSEFAHSVSFVTAIEQSSRWLVDAFSNKAEAKRHFGQTLAPAASYQYQVLVRQNLSDTIVEVLQSTSPTVVAVLGEEGAGKSWVVANALLHWVDRPVTVFMSAKDVKPSTSYTNIIEQIVDRLIVQSGQRPTDDLRSFWKDQVAIWKGDGSCAPKLILCVDGLNENPDVDWPRWINGAAVDLAKLGGRLLITDREAHYTQTIKDALAHPTTQVDVSGWSRQELQALLDDRVVNFDELDIEVQRSLANPRLLGIALSLDQIPLEGLTRQRLLFEYIRHSQAENRLGETPFEFSTRLADHAADVRSKAERQETESLGRFAVSELPGASSFSLSSDLLFASTSQFYTQLPTPGQYRLSEDGLNVALGIGILSALKETVVAKRHPAEALDRLLEPIEALDMTADVVFAALQFAATDDEASPIQSALLGRFLQLQNIRSQIYPAFLSVVAQSVDVALDALYDIDRARQHPSLKPWLVRALRNLRQNSAAWAKMAARIDPWLRLYTLLPEPKMKHFGQTPQEGQEYLASEVKRVRQKHRGLTPAERIFLNANCTRDDSFEASVLVEDAFLLLAGMPLSPMASALSAWAFHYGLNGWWDAPSEEFCALIRFNRIDWNEAEIALRSSVAPLADTNLSTVGRWCLATIWAAIATDKAHRDREVLLDVLNPDRHDWKGGKLVERLSPTDPCDPSALAPENLSFAMETAEKQDFSTTYRNRSGKDVVFKLAQPALCRWLPDLAVETERRLADEIIKFDLPDLGLAIHELSAESAMLPPEAVSCLCDIARTHSRRSRGETPQENEEWRAAQFALLAVVPHLSPQEQFNLLNSLVNPGSMLVAVAEMFSEVDAESFERAYLNAYKEGRTDRMIALLCFAAYSGAELTAEVQEVLLAQALDESEETFLAIETLAWRGSVDILQRFTNSGWSAEDVTDNSERAKKFYGSIILIKTAAAGLLDVLDLLERIEPSAFNYAAERLQFKIAHSLTQILDSCVSRMANAVLPAAFPVASKYIDTKDPTNYPRTDVKLDDGPVPPNEAICRANETDDEFRARVENAGSRFRNFEDRLKSLDASEVLQDIGREPIKLVCRDNLQAVQQWAAVCVRATSGRRRQLANLALTIASVLVEYDDKAAQALFDIYADIGPAINLTYDLRELGHADLSIWQGSAGPKVEALRKRRLDEATDDQAIAEAVDGAMKGGHSEFLRHFVEHGLATDIPAIRARALMVAGFMDQATWIDTVFASVASETGLVGDALKSARYAYDRNAWSRFWFALMCAPETTKTDFWRYSVILRKIVDFRLEYWAREISGEASLWSKFGPVLKSKVKYRIKKWKDERSKTLLGKKVPDQRYVRN